MAEQLDNLDEESFIILDSTPGASLDLTCGKTKSGAPVQNGDVVQNGSLDKAQIEDALKDLSMEGSMALKASFKIGDSPSPGSMMVASTIITDDKSTEELQKRFGELLDENIVLKETLKHNNDSMKEHFQLIATCQQDMVKTHEMHKDKFEETKQLVEKLRQENRKLKTEITTLVETAAVNVETGEAKVGLKTEPSLPIDPVSVKTEPNIVVNANSGPSSALEFVTSPDDETIERLTAQLALVEKQRREVITENEKLTWQKESLETIVDATAKERDELREKLKDAEINLYPAVQQRDQYIKQQHEKYVSLQTDLKAAQMRILELENVKLEFAKYKNNLSEMVRNHRESMAELNDKFKETTSNMLQPAQFMITWEPESRSEYGAMGKQVQMYDKALGHLADMLTRLTSGVSDALIDSMNIGLNLSGFTLGHSTAEQFKTSLDTFTASIEALQGQSMNNIGQVRATLQIFQDIFTEYKEAVRKLAIAEKDQEQPANVETLTAALVARGEEIQALLADNDRLKARHEEVDLLKAQLDLYKSDFLAERESREKMVSERDTAFTDLRKTKKMYEELKKQVDGNKLSPPVQSRPQAVAVASATKTLTRAKYTCPKCMRFSTDLYNVMEDHFSFCLDDF